MCLCCAFDSRTPSSQTPTSNCHPLTPDINVGCVCLGEPVKTQLRVCPELLISPPPADSETSSVSLQPSAAQSMHTARSATGPPTDVTPALFYVLADTRKIQTTKSIHANMHCSTSTDPYGIDTLETHEQALILMLSHHICSIHTIKQPQSAHTALYRQVLHTIFLS